MKVFWKNVEFEEKPEFPQSLERMEMPGTSLHALRTSLRSSTALLPEPARQFKEWKVGLLERFQNDDFGP